MYILTTLKNFRNISERVLLLSLLCIFIGFTASRALLSIGMAGVLLAGILNYKEVGRDTFLKGEWWSITVLFWGVVFSGCWSSNTAVWLNFVRIHLPFLLLPLGFAMFKPLQAVQFRSIMWLYVAVFTVSVVFVLGNYLLHFHEVNHQIIIGGTIPMPFSHIRYALLVVMAFFAALWLAASSRGVEHKIAFSIALFLLVMVHVLSVRSAIFSLYAGLLVFLCAYAKQWGYRRTGMLFLGLIVVVVILFTSIPSLENKVKYMRYDIMKYTEAQHLDASDGMRIRSWKAAVSVAQEQSFFGVGYGDVYDAMQAWYIQHFPDLQQTQQKLPHNQILWWWVTLGWLGAVLSVGALLFPLFKFWSKSNWLFKVFYMVLFTSFLWEPTLEEQMGTGLCVVWLVLLIHHVSGKENA